MGALGLACLALLTACTDPTGVNSSTGGSGGGGSDTTGSGGGGSPPCEIGEPAATPTLLAKLPDLVGGRTSVASRDGSLIFADAGKLVAVPANGGAAVTLATDPTIEPYAQFVVAGDSVVYYGSDLELRKISLSGGPSVDLAESDIVNGGIALDPAQTTVYWHAFNDDFIAALDLSTGHVEQACPLPEGTRFSGTTLLHDGKSTLYWAGRDSQERDIIARCTIGGASEIVLTTHGAPPSIAISASHLYWIEQSNELSGLFRMPLAGGATELLDAVGLGPIHVAGEVVHYGVGSGKIRRLDGDFTCPAAVVVVPTEAGSFGALISDEDTLSGITSDGQVFSVAR